MNQYEKNLIKLQALYVDGNYKYAKTIKDLKKCSPKKLLKSYVDLVRMIAYGDTPDGNIVRRLAEKEILKRMTE